MKTLSIKNINIGRFGNKLMYLNNLFQISHHFGFIPKWPHFENDYIFDFSDSRQEPNISCKEIASEFFIENKDYSFRTGDYELGFGLGNLFFEFDYLSTNELFSFKEKLIKDDKENVSKRIGIHFRGTDFINWDPVAILPFEYYYNSIKYVLENIEMSPEENLEFFVCTDDPSLDAYLKTIEMLKKENQSVELGVVGDMIQDFTKLAYCDVVVSSPSTFAIAASFCGKKNKIILNSKLWIDYMLEKKDVFWTKVNQGGNQNYRNHKTI